MKIDFSHLLIGYMCMLISGIIMPGYTLTQLGHDALAGVLVVACTLVIAFIQRK